MALVIGACRIESQDGTSEEVEIDCSDDDENNVRGEKKRNVSEKKKKKIFQLKNDEEKDVSFTLKTVSKQEIAVGMSCKCHKEKKSDKEFCLSFKRNLVRSVTPNSSGADWQDMQGKYFVFDLYYLPSVNNELDKFTRIGTLKIPCKEYNQIDEDAKSTSSEVDGGF